MSEVLELLLSRVSIRFFEDKPIPDDVINKILEAGIRAPTAGGMQQWFFIVVKDPEKRKAIHRLLRDAHYLYATRVLSEPMSVNKVDKWMRLIERGMYYAPIYIAAYIDLRRRFCRDEYKGFEELMAVQSLAAAIENMIIAAYSMGLGAVWLGVPLLMEEEFNRILEPPSGCRLGAIIALGYPAEKPKLRPRKSLSEVVKVI